MTNAVLYEPWFGFASMVVLLVERGSHAERRS